MIHNSPLQSQIASIKCNVEALKYRNKEALSSIKDSIKTLESSNQPYKISNSKLDGSEYNLRGRSPNYRATQETNDYMNSIQLNYDYRNRNGYEAAEYNYSIPRQGGVSSTEAFSPKRQYYSETPNHTNKKYNFDYSVYNSSQQEYNNHPKTQKLQQHIVNPYEDLSNQIYNLKLQVAELEKEKYEIELKTRQEQDQAINHSNEFNSSNIPYVDKDNKQNQNLNDISDLDFINELKKRFEMSSKVELLSEISRQTEKNSVKEEFVSKTVKICRDITLNKDANIIHTWRWFKEVIQSHMDYCEVRRKIKNCFHANEKDIKRIAIACIDQAYSNKRNVSKIKKLLMTEPNSRPTSKEKECERHCHHKIK